MFGNFNGNMIDASSVNVLINKLELYIENEEKIINDIVVTLNKLNDNYRSDDNGSLIREKTNNLVSSLYVILYNKKKITEYLKGVIIQYRTMNANVESYYGIN